MITMITMISIFFLIFSGISGYFLLEPEFAKVNMFLASFFVLFLTRAWPKIEKIKPSLGRKIFVATSLIVFLTIIQLISPSLDESEKRAVLLMFFEFCTATSPLLFR